MLDRVLIPGSIVIFDESGDAMHEFRAFFDYLAGYARQFRASCSDDDVFTRRSRCFEASPGALRAAASSQMCLHRG